jgi:hypothetical protein
VKRWNEGIKRMPPRLPSDGRLFNIWFALRKQGTIGHRGIWFKGLNFFSTELLELREYLQSESKVIFKFNENDMSLIYVYSEKHKCYLDVPCKNVEVVAGLTWPQYLEIRAIAKKKAKATEAVTASDILQVKQGYLKEIPETAKRETIASRRQRAIRTRVESNFTPNPASVIEYTEHGHETSLQSMPRKQKQSKQELLLSESKQEQQESLTDDEKRKLLKRRAERGPA